MEVAVIDYGAGNLRSVISALRNVECDVTVVDANRRVNSARAIILPGVGAAADTMVNLQRRGLSDLVREWIAAERPFMGICMGMQALFTYSDEGGGQECLDILQGPVERLPDRMKVPHMGWNQVRLAGQHRVFRGIPDNSNFYFVHSYAARPTDESIVAGRTEYGVTFCSAVIKDSLFATQFHPEKSGALGLKLYRNFVDMAAT
jgi:imidazole glycerol-phosphate synthase subunit HisH